MADRQQIALRVSIDALKRIDALANTQERNRSDMIRRCLSRGLQAEEADAAAAEAAKNTRDRAARRSR